MKSIFAAYAIALLVSVNGLAQTGSVAVNIVSPHNGQLTDIELHIVATATSTYELEPLTASVDGRSVDLVFTQDAYLDRFGFPYPGWTNQLSMDGLPRGTNTLTVLATDVFGDSSSQEVRFVYDRPPTLTVLQPLANTVVSNELFVQGTSADDDPAGCLVTLSANGQVLATNHDTIAMAISLARYGEGVVSLGIDAEDSAGQHATAAVPVIVEPSPRLSEVESVNGPIWDVQPDRLLYLQSIGGLNVLTIRLRPTGQDTVVASDADIVPRYGFLTPKGAIFVEQPGDVTTALVYDSHDGVLINLGQPNSGTSLVANGNQAIWSVASTLMFRDLVAGTNTILSTSAINWKNSVAVNGDVVYGGNDLNIYRYRAGNTTQLTTDNQSIYPSTDGINVVYSKRNGGVFLYDGVSEIELSPIVLSPGETSGSQLNGGWVAFTQPDFAGQLQVWRRSPSGAMSQVTFFGDSSTVAAVAPNGDVAYVHDGRLYLSQQGFPPIGICSTSVGGSLWWEGNWYIVIGRSLFLVNTGNTSIGLDLPSYLPTGQFGFRITAGDGQRIIIQASTDLYQWASIGTNTLNGYTADFIDPHAGSLGHRFYRAVSPTD